MFGRSALLANSVIAEAGWWSSLVGSGAATAKLESSKLDALGNLYVGGWTDPLNNGNQVAILGKYSADGALLWCKQSSLPSGVLNDGVKGIGIDSGNTIWVGGNFGTVSRFDTSGNLLSSSRYTLGQEMVLASNSWGGIFFGTNTSNTYNQYMGYLSGGSGSWADGAGFQNGSYTGGPSFDSSSNIFIATRRRVTSSDPFYSSIAKFNPSGTPLWVVNSSAGTGYRQMQAPAADSSGNIYAIHYSTATGSLVRSVLKRTSSGAAVYCKALPTTLSYIPDMAVDNLNSCLYMISGLSGQSNMAGLTKFSMNGTLLWVRQFSSQTGGTVDFQSVKVDSKGFIYLSGCTATSRTLAVKLPPNDAGLGTWGDLIIATYTNGVTSTTDYTADSFSLSSYSLGGTSLSVSATSISATTTNLAPSSPIIIT